MSLTGLSNMTVPEPHKSQSSQKQDETDLLLRASRRGLFIVLLMILGFGATVLARTLWPNSALANWPTLLPLLLPLLIVMMMVAGRILARGRAWDPNSLEVKKMQQDEFRRMNLSRAQRAALIVVLVLQVPLGLLFSSLPAMRAVMAMAVSTTTLGMVALIALFLFFDRE